MDQGRRATQALRGAASGRGLEAFLVPRIEQGACVSLQPPVQAWPTESSSSSCARRRRGAKARRAAPSCTWRSRWRSSPRLPGVLQVAGGAACVAGQLAWCHIAEKGGSCNVELRLPGCLLRHYTWPLLLNKTTPTGPPRRLQVQARAVGSVPLHPLPASVLPARRPAGRFVTCSSGAVAGLHASCLPSCRGSWWAPPVFCSALARSRPPARRPRARAPPTSSARAFRQPSRAQSPAGPPRHFGLARRPPAHQLSRNV